jgi:hypothetical protein
MGQEYDGQEYFDDPTLLWRCALQRQAKTLLAGFRIASE